MRDKRGYRLIPSAEAVGSGTVERGPHRKPGFGITVVPLQYVSAPTLLKLLDSFATKPGTVRADPQRNLDLIQGNGAERRTAIETVLSFDAGLDARPVGRHLSGAQQRRPSRSSPSSSGSWIPARAALSQTLVKLQPIARLNAILVITRKPDLLRTAQTWITRLDKSDTAATGVKVYHVRYGDARQIAALLNDIFRRVAAAAARSTAPTNQIAPGAGVATISSERCRRPDSQGGLAHRRRAVWSPAASADSRLAGGRRRRQAWAALRRSADRRRRRASAAQSVRARRRP